MVMKLYERETYSMIYGKEVEKEVYRKLGRRKWSRLLGSEVVNMYKDVTLFDEETLLSSKADMVLELDNNKLVVIEIKNSQKPKRIPLGHRYQLAATALVAKKTYRRPVEAALIYYVESDDLVKIRYDKGVEKHILNVVKRIKKIIEGHEPPIIKTEKCVGCGYRGYCY